MTQKPTYEELENRIKELESMVLDNKQPEEGLLPIMSEAEKLANFGSWKWDMVRDKWTMSDNWLKIHGYKNKVLTTEELLTIAHPDDTNRIQAAFDECIKSGVPYKIEHRIVKQDTHEVRDIRAYGRVQSDSAGKPVKLYGAAQDITEYKRQEIELKQSEEQYRSLVERTPDIVTRVDSEGQIVFVNHAAKHVYGIPPEECLGRSAFDFIHPEDRDVTIASFNCWLQSPDHVLTYENRIVSIDGQRTHHMAWMILPERDESGSVIGFSGTARDITEIKESEQERENLIVRLEEKTIEQERLMYTVSHDLKSPLVTISGFCGIAKEELDSGDIESCKQTLDVVSHAAKRMQRLLGDLLEISRTGFKVDPSETFNLSVLINEAIENVSGVISDNKTTVEIEPDLPDVTVDRKYFLQVIENLLSNASKYSQSAKGGSLVKFGVVRDTEELTCYVKDNGIGIESQYLEKAFDLFESFDSNSEGTGVGLAIVKRIVESHGGRIWAESKGLGHGTTFFFTLPEAKP